jgi:hypothetical protein
MDDILILGGYGNFGKRISKALLRHRLPIIIAGRDETKARSLAKALRAEFPQAQLRWAAIDAESGLDRHLRRLRPSVTINTCGPYQTKNYDIAEACIASGSSYIDLADARDFVTGITSLHDRAEGAGVSVISGASTVPGLSSAVIEHYRQEFTRIESLRMGISPGQRAERGLATTQAILSYIGKPLGPAGRDQAVRYGWQDLYRQPYPELGPRWMANCDVPDLDLFPERYGINAIQFSAGMELAPIHFGIWAFGWLTRLGLSIDWPRHAKTLLGASNWFDRFGSDAGGMHVVMRGEGTNGAPHERSWFIIAKNGDGPQIPCVPAILLAKKLALRQPVPTGAMACVGLVTLEDYLEELKIFAVRTYQR